MEEQQEKQTEKKRKPTIGEMATVLLPTSGLIAGTDALIHAPLPITIGGIVLTGVLAYNNPDWYERARRALLEHGVELPERKQKERQTGEYTFSERLMGKHLQEGATSTVSKQQATSESGQVDTEPLQHVRGGVDVLETSNADFEALQQRRDEEMAPLAFHKATSDLFTFSQLLDAGFLPTINKIFVGRTMDGRDIYVRAEDLCHVALAGKTGGGKGSLMRLIMVQLAYIGAKMLLLNPHYMRWVRAKDGPQFDEDWTPFEGKHPRTGKPYLEVSPIDSADPEPIARCLVWSIETLLAKRKAEGREGGKLFAPYFIILDEWPDVVSEFKKAPEHMEKLLRQGRKYGIFVVVASQDFQVKTMGLDGGSVRKCLLTTFYTGGDPTTAKELLYEEKPSSIPENKLGKGIVLLRCTGTQNEAVLACVPFVDNKAVYRLLGPSTFKGAKQQAEMVNFERDGTQEEEGQSTASSNARDQAIDRLTALYKAGKLTDEQFLNLIEAMPEPEETQSQQAHRSHMPAQRLPENVSYFRAPGASQPTEMDGIPMREKETRMLPEVELEREVKQERTGGFTHKLSPELQRAYDFYHQGYTTSRTLAPMMDIGKTKAAELLQELKRRKLVS